MARKTAAREDGRRKPVPGGGRRPGGTRCLSAPPAVPGWAPCPHPPPCAPRPSAGLRLSLSLGSADQRGRPRRPPPAPCPSPGCAAPGRAQVRSGEPGCCRPAPGCGLARVPRAPRSASRVPGHCLQRMTYPRLQEEGKHGVTGAWEETRRLSRCLGLVGETWKGLLSGRARRWLLDPRRARVSDRSPSPSLLEYSGGTEPCGVPFTAESHSARNPAWSPAGSSDYKGPSLPGRPFGDPHPRHTERFPGPKDLA